MAFLAVRRVCFRGDGQEGKTALDGEFGHGVCVPIMATTWGGSAGSVRFCLLPLIERGEEESLRLSLRLVLGKG